jgi:hypothetical protein
MKTSTIHDWKYLADYDDQKMIRHVGSHLKCFHGGNWLFGMISLSVSEQGDVNKLDNRWSIIEQPIHCRRWTCTRGFLLEHLCVDHVSASFFNSPYF